MAQSLKRKDISKVATNKTTQKEEIFNTIVENFGMLKESDKLKILSKIGVGNKDIDGLFFTCHKCGEVCKKSDFYVSTEVGCSSGITPICKKCAEKLAVPVVNNKKQQPNKETVISALNFLRKPFLDSIWQASLLEAANTATGKTKSNVWTSYAKNMQMINYNTLNYESSDFYNGGKYNDLSDDDNLLPKNEEVLKEFEKNKSDVIRLIGYDPFEKEKLSDQPYLYSNLIGMLDSSEDANQDRMRTSSIITIVRGFLQNSQIDDMIAKLMQDPLSAEKNVATIKSLQEVKKNISTTISKLAEDSCISMKHSKNSKKGEDSWTGKVKKMKELNLRDAEVNGFDIGTCKGMKQVMDMSHRSILEQIKLDENDYTEMISQQKDIIKRLREDREEWQEKARILLRENIDLKSYLEELGLINESMLDSDTILTQEDGDLNE